MAEQRLPVFRQEFLPESAMVTTMSVATHAPQEITLDNAYSLTIYDPSLQASDVQERYASIPISRVAQIACWAVGADQNSTRLVLNDQEVGERPEPTTRQRLQHAIKAAPFVRQYFERGLLKSRVTGDVSGAFELSPSDKQLLTLMAKGINPQDTSMMQALQELDRAFYETEPSLLSVLTKFFAQEPLSPADGAIVQLNPSHDPYAGNRVVPVRSRAPTALKRPRIPRVPQEHVLPEDYHPLGGIDLSQMGFVRENTKERKDRHKAFAAELVANGIPVDPETGERRVVWKGTTLTFNFPDCLTDHGKTAAILYILGLRYNEMKPLYNSDSLQNAMEHINTKLKVPPGADLALFALHNGYLRFDKPTEPAPKNLPEANKVFMRRMIEDGYGYRDFVEPLSYAKVLQAVKYCYEQFDVDTMRSLTLAAATHGIVGIDPEMPQTAPDPWHWRDRVRNSYQSEVSASLAQDEYFMANVQKCLQVDATTGDIKITWKQAELTFNFTGVLPLHIGVLAALQCFDLSFGKIRHEGIRGSDRAHTKARRTMGATQHDDASILRGVIQGGYLKNIDASAYALVHPLLNSKEQNVLRELYYRPPKAIASRTPLTSRWIHNKTGSMYRKFGLGTGICRLLIAGVLEGQLPEVAEQLSITT